VIDSETFFRPLVRERSTRIPTDRRKRPRRFLVVIFKYDSTQGAPFQGTRFTSMTPAAGTLGSQQFTGAGPFSYHPMPPLGGYQGVYSYPPPPPPPPTQGWSQDNDEVSFDDFTRLFATPAQNDEPSFHTPLAQLRRPARDVRPPDRHSYPTDHVHAQRKRGRHGKGV